MRIALIHALKHSIVPIEASFARLWPDARLMNLLDDSLSADLARDGRLTDAMTERFLSLGRYAACTGADAILFTCSAFGPCIEAVARAHAPMPVLKPNEAMIEQAAARGRRIGLLSTFAPTLVSMPPEFPASVEIVPKLAEGALAALDRGDRAEHDRLVVEASTRLARLRPDRAGAIQHGAGGGRWSPRRPGRPVLTTPDSAVMKLKQLLGVERDSGLFLDLFSGLFLRAILRGLFSRLLRRRFLRRVLDRPRVAVGGILRGVLQPFRRGHAKHHRALGDQPEVVPGLLVLCLGGAAHDLVPPLLDGGHQVLVLGLCNLPDDDVEIGFSHCWSLLPRDAPARRGKNWRTRHDSNV